MQDSRLLVAGTLSGANNAITGQSIVGTAGTAIQSAYSVDLNPNAQTGVDFGEGSPLYLKWLVQTSISGASGGVQVNVVTDSNANLTTTPNTIASATIPTTSYAAGSFGYIQVPPQQGSLSQEFLGATFTPLTSNSTAGAIIAEFTNVIDDAKKFYKAGFAVA